MRTALSTAAAALAALAALGLATAPHAAAQPSTPQPSVAQQQDTQQSVAWPEHYAAPYADISLYPTFDLTDAAAASGQKFFTLAFILNTGGECHAGWSSYVDLDAGFLQDEIAALRAEGGDVAISVGGANGQEPASSCTSPEALQAQYQRVIDAYGISHIDFDVEGASLSDTATVDRRNKAIAGLEAANPGLHVSYTLPVLPSALTQPGIDLLADARSNGVRVDVVNMMTMDYGVANDDMGGAAISAATALVDQLRAIWGDKSDAELWAMVGITPMIGQNDSQGEIFTQDDAAEVIAFARAHGVGALAFWSAGRDNGGCAGQTYASPSCSGLAQDPFAFTSQLAAFGGAA